MGRALTSGSACQADFLLLPVRVLATPKVCDDNDNLRLLNGIEESILTDPGSIEVAELAFEAPDIGTEVRLAAERRIDDGPNLLVEGGKVLVLLQSVLEAGGFCDRVPIRQSDTVSRLCPCERSSAS